MSSFSENHPFPHLYDGDPPPPLSPENPKPVYVTTAPAGEDAGTPPPAYAGAVPLENVDDLPTGVIDPTAGLFGTGPSQRARSAGFTGSGELSAIDDPDGQEAPVKGESFLSLRRRWTARLVGEVLLSTGAVVIVQEVSSRAAY